MAENRQLNSWSEIARYMGRGVRTVQRYEQNLALPIHRPSGKEHSSVLAFADELDEWLRNSPILDGPSISDDNPGWSYAVTVGVSAVGATVRQSCYSRKKRARQSQPRPVLL